MCFLLCFPLIPTKNGGTDRQLMGAALQADGKNEVRVYGLKH
jgi:hypothetical protein